MPQITIGKLHVSADRKTVTFLVDDARVELTAEDVARLEAFLSDHSPQERRVGFRVPVTQLATPAREPFRVHVYADERMLAAQPVDLSLTGIQLATEDEVAVGSRVRITLVHGRHRSRLEASVVRAGGGRCALRFEGVMHGERLDPPDELLVIFRLLEQAFLKTRLEAGADG